MAAGSVTGLFGIGGGAAIVPVPFEVLRLRGVLGAVCLQLCIATALAIIPRHGAVQAGRRGCPQVPTRA
ncbi:MAG TPA: hypothetical protein VE993_03910 [Stellaceae bacterium]|nr:hypothetical protein [Stellaceae bacterium]